MKGEPLITGVFAFLLVACGPSAPPGARAVNSDKHRKDDGERSNVIQHFWFDYQFPPQPGLRVWINVHETNWVEVYPDGTESRYEFRRKDTIDGLSGIVVAKTRGELQTSQTLNDGSFEAFLPDKKSPRLILYFRNRIDSHWQPWRPLAQLNSVE